MEKILPVADSIITHDPPIANLFSVLKTNPNTKSWIANHFVNLYIHKDDIFDNFYDRNAFFYGCPWIQVIQIRREILQRLCEHIIDYIKVLLNEGFYVYAVGNTEHIPAYHNNQYFAHNLMIYGYDDSSKEFYISDFFVNGKYSRKKCSYDELEKALQTAEMNRHFVNLIYGIKLKEIEYKFEVDLLLENLTDHLKSTNLFCKYKTRQDEEFYSNKGGNNYNYFSYAEMKKLYYFGLSYYDKLAEMAERKSKKLKRPLDLAYEHKLLMEKRIDFIYQNKYISQFYYDDLKKMCESIKTNSLMIRNGYIKYQLSQSNSFLERIKDKILVMKEGDFALTEKLIEALNH